MDIDQVTLDCMNPMYDISKRCLNFSLSDYDTRLSKSENNQEMNPAIEKAMNALKFVAQHVKNEDNFNSVRPS